MNNLKNISLVRKQINRLVIEYVENKITPMGLRKGMTKFANTEIFKMLSESGNSNLIAIIDVGFDITYHLGQEGYHSEDPGSADSILRHYYEEILKI